MSWMDLHKFGDVNFGINQKLLGHQKPIYIKLGQIIYNK